MQGLKRKGILLIIIFAIIAAAIICYFLFNKDPVYGGYFVFNEDGNGVNYGYIY